MVSSFISLSVHALNFLDLINCGVECSAHAVKSPLENWDIGFKIALVMDGYPYFPMMCCSM
jgi:hypothetical protein